MKPTEAGRAFAHEAGETTEAPPYPGAKDYLLITDRIDDGPWLSELITRSQAELPAPRKRKKAKEKR